MRDRRSLTLAAHLSSDRHGRIHACRTKGVHYDLLEIADSELSGRGSTAKSKVNSLRRTRSPRSCLAHDHRQLRRQHTFTGMS